MTPQRLDFLKSEILNLLQVSTRRREDTLARRFGGPHLRVVGGYYEDPHVSDALFALVQEGKIEWFGAEAAGRRGDLPMWYRVPNKRTVVA